MDLKIAAMKLWSEALMQAYDNAGGRLPLPTESTVDPNTPADARRSCS